MNESKPKGRLFNAYRCMHEQGFVPIFVENGPDPKMLIEACIQADIRCIEYTLRCPDADKMIPWIRQNYPDLYLLVGSTLDNDDIIRKAKVRHPQLLTLSELAEMGVDGFVSMVGWKLENIEKYSSTHIVCPCAETVREAFLQLGAGSHFIKVLGPSLEFVKNCRKGPTFGACPIMITSGMNLEKIDAAVAAGAVIIGTGFDLLLNNQFSNISCRQVTDILKQYCQTVKESRAKYFPEMGEAIGRDAETWLNSLPHIHPFEKRIL